MRIGSHKSATAGLIVAAILCSQPFAVACVVDYKTVHVRKSFRIVVRNGQRPIAGVRVDIYKRVNGFAPEKPALSLLTDVSGAIEVARLNVGSYLAATEGPGQGSAVNLEVGSTRSDTQREVILGWPATTVLKMKALAGVLASNNPWTPFENIHAELWTAGADLPLAITDTWTEGRFRFNETEPGIYILRVNGQQKRAGEWQVKGDIPIELSNADPGLPESLSLHLAMTSCGITYDECPVPDVVSVTSRRMRFIDPLGAAIGKAKYELLDERGAVIAGGSTDVDGIAVLPFSLLGKMTLQIASPGFTLLTQPLNLLAPDEHSRDILVSLAVHGSDRQCSAVSLEKHATP